MTHDKPRAHLTKISGVDVHWVDHPPARNVAVARSPFSERAPRDSDEAHATTAPAVVLIHGLLDWHRSWDPVIPRLVARGFRVLALDLPGHGLSGRTDVPYTLEWNARIVGSWMDVAEVPRATIVGHSYGGGVAQMLCLTHSARMDRLALVAPGGFGREVSVAVRLASVPFLFPRFAQPWLWAITDAVGPIGGRGNADAEERRWIARKPGSARALHRTVKDVVGLGGQARHFIDRGREAPSLPPTIVFWGDKDRVIPFVQAKRLPRYVEGARIVRFAGAGHYLHHSFPEAFTNDLVAFMHDDAAPPASVRGRTVA